MFGKSKKNKIIVSGQDHFINTKEVVIKNKSPKKSAKNDLEKKEKITKSKKNPKKHYIKKYFFGVAKEFERITWVDRKTLFTNFLVVLVIMVFFALIFTGVTIAINSI